MTLKSLANEWRDYIPTKIDGRRVRRWRHKRRWSMMKLATEVDLTVGQVWRIETGNSGATQKRISLIAQALGVHKEDLMK